MKRFLILFLALLLVVGTVACGSDMSKTTPDEPSVSAVPDEAPVEGVYSPAGSADATAAPAPNEEPAPTFTAGKYCIRKYGVGDVTVEGEMLISSGMAETALTLNADHTGLLTITGQDLPIGWTDDGSVTISDMPYYSMDRIDAETIVLHYGDVLMTMQIGYSAQGAAAEPQTTEAPEPTEAPAAPETGAEGTSSRAPYGDSDGVIDRATLAGLYRWMSAMPSDFCYALTFDEIGAAAGKQGCVNSRDDDTPSAIWTDGGNAIVTVTFKDRKGDGNYTCCAIVKSGLSSDECNAADVSGFPKVASSTPAGTNPTETQTFEVQVGFSGPKVNITASIPTKNWYLQKKYIYCAPNAERADYSSSYFKIECEESLEKIDFYKDSFENLEKLEPRTIGGIEMQGRSYKNVGMDWIEYYGEIAEGVWVSIKLTGVDLSAGTETEAILMSLTFALQ